MRVEFYGLTFNLPDGWVDITDDLPDGSPLSLARNIGAGTVQFSIGKYRSGKEPNITVSDLRRLLGEFCKRNQMDCSIFKENTEGKVQRLEESATVGKKFIVASYLSNGMDILLATYVCTNIDHIEMKRDIIDLQKIFNSLDF